MSLRDKIAEILFGTILDVSMEMCLELADNILAEILEIEAYWLQSIMISLDFDIESKEKYKRLVDAINRKVRGEL